MARADAKAALGARLWVLCIFCAICAGCNKTPKKEADGIGGVDFLGCYSVEKNAPAQIRVQQNAQTPASDGDFFMQMPDAKGDWDSPEPLFLGNAAAKARFGEALDIPSDGVLATIARPDEVMEMAALDPALVGVDARLDSAFAIRILQAVNTVYKVDCPTNHEKGAQP